MIFRTVTYLIQCALLGCFLAGVILAAAAGAWVFAGMLLLAFAITAWA
jgi:hypothetical protein